MADVVYTLGKKKTAIIFFGLTRSLEKTINSLKENLFDPLGENLIDYDIFIHTYKIYGSYNNIWSKEHTDNYKNEDIEKILNPTFYISDIQQKVADSIDFNEYYKNLGNWTGMDENLTKYLIKNMCLALYSKKQISLLFEKHKERYDNAIIIRPDLELHTKIDVRWFAELTDSNIIVPEKEWFYGCNDRMCIGKPDTILYCGMLFDELKSYSEKKSIISERYFIDKLTEKKINIIPKDIDYDTIRI